MTKSLEQWLERIERLHPREIDLSLDRVKAVADRLGLLPCSITAVTVAGTNGKGSCVAAVSAMLAASGHITGTYTSPHLLHYNERICIDGKPADDRMLVTAFEQIDSARADISLTYFEFGTLAALLLFKHADVDVMVLETGLGGRLDAVNIIDAALAVISSIDLDHQEWLGDTRELIALEKAGIFRLGAPVVCADPDPPQTLFESAVAMSCPLYLVGRDFDLHPQSDDVQWWRWKGRDGSNQEVDLGELPRCTLLPVNIAAAIQAVMLLPLQTTGTAIRNALATLVLPGRQQIWQAGQQRWLLDVSHNPHAARELGRRLVHERKQGGQIHLVLAMMQDKDHTGYIRGLESGVDFWYIAQVDLARCLGAEQLLEHVTATGVKAPDIYGPFVSVSDACMQARSHVREGDTIVVCGSFFTVSEAMQWLGIQSL
jgi:dihydrofolate synthase/folylpolyglutamate synthase